MIGWFNRRAHDSDERGAIAVLVAMLMTALCVAGAFAIDLGSVATLRNQAQTAVNDAALSAARLLAAGATTSSVTSSAETYLQQDYGFTGTINWNGCPTSLTPSGFTPAGACITFNGGDVNVVLPPQLAAYTLGHAANLTGATIETGATASVSASYGPSPCGICLLDTTTGVTDQNGNIDGLDVEGSSTVSVTSPNGTTSITVDSTNSTSAAFVAGGKPAQGSTASATGAINVVGGAMAQGSATFSTPLNQNNTSYNVPDPLWYLQPVLGLGASATMPSGTCTGTSSGATANPSKCSIVGSGSCNGCSITVPPGNYSSIDADGSGTVYLQGGIYVISGNGSSSCNPSNDPSPCGLTSQGQASTPWPNSSSPKYNIIEEAPTLLYFACGNATTVQSCSSASGATAANACPSGTTVGGQMSLEASGNIYWDPYSGGTGSNAQYSNLAIFYDHCNSAQILGNGNTTFGFSGTVYAHSAAMAITASGSSISSLLVVGALQAKGYAPVTVSYNSGTNTPVQTSGSTANLCTYSTTASVNTC